MTKEELLEEAKRRYPVGTKFIPAHLGDIDDYCIITDDTVLEFMYNNVVATVNGQSWLPKEEHYPKYGSEHCYNRTVYADGKWAPIVKISSEDLLKEAKRRYPIGTKYKTAAINSGDDIYTVSEQSFSVHTYITGIQIWAEYTKGILYDNGRWAEIITQDESDRPERKYKIGDKVQVCDIAKCNGFGYYHEPEDSFDAINGTGNNIGVIDFMKYSPSRNEWYYHLDCHYTGAYIAEHALSLYVESKYKVGDEVWLSVEHHGVPPRWVTISEVLKDGYYLDGWSGHFPEHILSLKEPNSEIQEDDAAKVEEFRNKLLEMYKPGTIFIPVSGDYDKVTVGKNWKLSEASDDESAWFVDDEKQVSAHIGYIYKYDEFAKIVGHELEEKAVFKEGDIVGISPDSDYVNQGKYRGEYMSGVVVGIKGHLEHRYVVHWADKTSNKYRRQDLIKWESKPTIIVHQEIPSAEFLMKPPVVTKPSTSLKMLPFNRI